MASYLIVSIVNFIFFLYLIPRNKDKQNLSFAFICLSASVYTLELFLINNIKDLETLTPLFIITRIGLFFVVTFILLFSLSVVKIHKHQNLIAIPFIINSLFLTIYHSLYPSQLVKVANSYYPDIDFVYYNLMISYLLGVLIAIVILIVGYFKEEGINKKKASWTMISYVMILILGYLAFVLKTNFFPIFGNLIILIFVPYIIITRKVLEIPNLLKIIIAKSASAGSLLFVNYCVIQFLLLNYFSLNLTTTTLLSIGLLFATFEFYPKLEMFLRKTLDIQFYSKKKNLKSMEDDLWNNLELAITYRDIFDTLENKLLKNKFVFDFKLFFQDREDKINDNFKLYNPLNQKFKRIYINKNDVLLEAIKNQKGVLLMEETKENVGEIFNELDSNISIPCISKNEIMGLLFLKLKKNYTFEEIQFFEKLIIMLGLCIERVEAYDQIMNKSMSKSLKVISLISLMNDYNHDIKAPFAVLKSSIECINNIDELKDLISRQSDRGLKLVQKMIRILNDKRQIQVQELNLNDVLNSVLELFPVRVSKKVLEFSEIPQIQGDFEELEILFINLIKNSAEAMIKGEINNQLTIKTRFKKEENLVSVEVSDNGAGMDEDKINSLWDKKDNLEIGKNGIGLSVIKRIIDEHNGEVYVTSELGVGTSFYIDFPIIHSIQKDSTNLQNGTLTYS